MSNTLSAPTRDALHFRTAARIFLCFLYQQTCACTFPFLIVLALWLTNIVRLPGLPRYDLLLIFCLGVQWMMYRTGMETKDELRVIALFHLIGLALEIDKTHFHSWQYPEAAWTKALGVPLYSGFMYASVASYLCQVWRRFDLRLAGWPRAWQTLPFATAIYLNFFTERFLGDFRWLLAFLIIVVFWRTRVQFHLLDRHSVMPLALVFVLIGGFIWVAENVGTFLGAWQYPNQRIAWHLVHPSKITSWSFLVMISFIAVAQLKHIKAARDCA